MTESLLEDLAALQAAVDRLGDLRPHTSSPQRRGAYLSNADVATRRVLVVGAGAAQIGLAYVESGAEHVCACDSDAISAPQPTKPGQLELRRCGWEALDPAHDEGFGVVHCDGLLHRVLEPMTLLRRLRAMTAPGATLLIGSMLLADPERSELLRFVPDRYAADASWWFVPGRLAFRWMVQTAGFEVQADLGEQEGPHDGFAVVHGYLRARAEEVR